MILKLAAVLLLAFVSVQGAGLYKGPRQPRTDCRLAECEYPEHSTKAHFSYEQGSCDEPSRWYELAECWYECNNETNHFQSPVNIRLANTEYEPYPMFRIHSKLCKRVSAKIKNNGHAPHFEVDDDDHDCDDDDSDEDDDCDDDDDVIKLTNVPMRPKDDVYIFREMHTHLGLTRDKGSEHSLNSKFYPMETHMVFWNNKYSDIVEAERSADGLAVIGVFVKVAEDDDDEDDEDEWESKDDTPGQRWPRTECTCDDDDDDCKKSKVCGCNVDDDCDGDSICRSDDDDDNDDDDDDSSSSESDSDEDDDNNKGRKYCSAPRRCDVRFARRLNSLMKKYYPEIREYDEDADEKDIDEGITPRDALPYDWSFYTYNGSLTTPPCFQTVQWMVMRCPIKVSRKAFELLQEIEDSDHYPLKTYGVDRPTQRGLDGQYEVKVKRNFRWSELSSRAVCNNDDRFDDDDD